jgi:hypothetical protein
MQTTGYTIAGILLHAAGAWYTVPEVSGSLAHHTEATGYTVPRTSSQSYGTSGGSGNTS